MATTKERILVTLTPDMAREIKAMAKKDRAPKATIAARLMRQALEDIHERYMVRVAEAHLKSTKKWLTPEQFWSEVDKQRRKRHG